jgi:type I restriction enzyme S subunit
MLTLKQDTMLGNIPKDWGVKPLKKLLKHNASGDWGDDGGPHMYRVLRSTNLTNERRLDLSDIAFRALKPEKVEQITPRKGDILLERSGGGPDQPVGRVGYVVDDLPGHAFSNFLHLLRPDKEEIDPSFLSWVLHRINRTGRILRLEQQTTQMRNLNFRDYLSMPLPVPPPNEQAVIARILEATNASIDRAQEAASQAAEVKRALSQELFSKGTRNEQQKKTLTGFIPKSWEVKQVSEVVTNFEYGLSLPMHLKGTTPILRMGNIQRGHVVMDGLKYVTLSPALLDRYLLKRGDVLFNRTNSQEWVGKVGIYRTDAPAVFASYLIRVHADSAQVDNYFLGQLLNSYDAQCRIKRFATPGVQQVNVNAKNLGKVLIPVPVGNTGLDEQREIAALLEAADERVRSYAPVIASLNQLKKSLMHDLLTGTVRIDPTKFEMDVTA